MSGPTLYIYLIHTESLTHRAMRVHGAIQALRTVAMKCGYKVKPLIILKPNPTDLQPKLPELNSMVTYDSVGDDMFDSLRQILSVEAISNIEKHKETWERIYETDSQHVKDLFLVLEDDVFVVPDGLQGFEKVLMHEKENPRIWDLLMLGLCEGGADGQIYRNLRDLIKVLPCKESYFITQQTAKAMYDSWTKYRYIMRTQMSWYIRSNPSLRVYYPTHRCFLDGSKVGITPSSIHPNNMLIFNREYMDMFSYMSKTPAEIQKDFHKIQSTYKAIEHLRNSDIMHIMGVLTYKTGKVKEAEKILRQAVEENKKQQGILNSRSDLMNNLVQLYEHMQDDLTDIFKTPSKFADPTFALSD